MKYFISTLALLLILIYCQAQTIEEVYRRPLKDVLKEVETLYQVKLNYSDRFLTGKSVDYAMWRFRSDVESTLHLILGPQDLIFTKTGDKTYTIEAFQYHRRPVEEGRMHLGLNLKTVQLSTGEMDESKSVVESKSAMLVFGENGENLPENAIHGLDALTQLLKNK